MGIMYQVLEFIDDTQALLARFKLFPCFIFGSQTLVELAKNLFFHYVSLWALALASTRDFPLPGTWIFENPMQLLLNKTCFEVYADYLESEEPENYALLLEVMRSIVKGESVLQPTNVGDKNFEESRVSSDFEEGTGEDQLDNIEQTLEHIRKGAYKRFQRTVAYKTLFEKIKESEKVTLKAYEFTN